MTYEEKERRDSLCMSAAPFLEKTMPFKKKDKNINRAGVSQ